MVLWQWSAGTVRPDTPLIDCMQGFVAMACVGQKCEPHPDCNRMRFIAMACAGQSYEHFWNRRGYWDLGNGVLDSIPYYS